MSEVGSDLLFAHVRDLPYFRGLLRATESRVYQGIHFEQPTLDLGCGDGHFAQATFSQTVNVAVDPKAVDLKEARQRPIYQLVAEGLGCGLPFPSMYFASVFSNSVLEHIPNLDEVLAETARVLMPGGLFVFCVPNDKFLPSLWGARQLERIGLGKLADPYRKFFNKVSRHHTCEGIPAWTRRLDQAGFTVEKAWDIIPSATFKAIELGHYLGIPSWIIRQLTGRWNLVRQPWNFVLLLAWLKQYYGEPVPQPDGVYSFYITRKR